MSVEHIFIAHWGGIDFLSLLKRDQLLVHLEDLLDLDVRKHLFLLLAVLVEDGLNAAVLGI